jgi:predicted helicase
LKVDDDIIREGFKLKDTSTFKLKKFRQELSKVKDWEDYILPILYRPFDKRYIYYSKWVVERPIYDTMKHMIKVKDNLALNINRQVKTSPKWCHALISNTLTEACYISNRTSEICYIHPLYVLPNNGNGGNGDLFNAPKHDPEPNIAENIYKTLKENYGNRIKPEQILRYIYAILYSNTYREKYAEFLKIDFPRIPFTADSSLFQQLSKLGETLSELHLLKHPSLNNSISKYKGKGDDDSIVKPTYVEEEKRIYINDEKYFDNITPDIWNYHIGGYQVMEKYLKDRKGRDMDDASHYCKIATCIAKTIEVQEKIDNIFSKAEKKVLEFK